MKNLLNLFFAMLIGVVSLSLSACGDNEDEPEYSPEEPIVGTWIVEEVTSPSYTNYWGGMLGSEEEWRQDFINEWTGKKLTFKAQQIENDVVYIEKHTEGKTDSEVTFEVSHADETTLTAYYTETMYKNGDRFCHITARMTMKRK